MAKFEPYSRRELLRHRRQWLRRNLWVVALLAVGIAALLAIASYVLATLVPGNVGWYLIGVVHAGAVGFGLHGLHSLFLAVDREALWHVRGAWGEDNTRSELQRAKRKRLIWGWWTASAFRQETSTTSSSPPRRGRDTRLEVAKRGHDARHRRHGASRTQGQTAS